MESAKSASLGSSLLVPSVQELIKTEIGAVPPRYLRPDQDQPIVSDADVPIVDLGKLVDEATMDSELAILHSACKDWGFFQLVNHGVSSTVVDNMNQPPQLRKPHLLPKLPLPFRDTLESYSLEVKNLAGKVLDQMAKALQMKPEEMKDIFSGNIRQTMRMNYYPPCPQPDKVIGLTPHSDGTGLTILLQVNEVEGLQIKKDGNWVPVKVLPNAFVVNVGDIVEIITNGVYRSIEHRATVNSEKERLSIASFHSPRFDGEIYPAPSLVSGETPALFRNVSVKEFFKGLFSRELQGKCYLDTLRI
ncbi:unnamed protein product [Linum tenue]|uniref:Fe2OG dioxygenase domain-containing protein n=1 Tax=Linum tenue TaxID=586396 RepID=A0AAV0P5W6_9ROSI|nr:unnamed protein product [Linum tenue]